MHMEEQTAMTEANSLSFFLSFFLSSFLILTSLHLLTAGAEQRFPNSCVRGPVSVSKNSHGSPNPCSRE